MLELANPLREIWAKGETAVNGWISMPGILSAETMARAGWDSLTVDLQHGTCAYSDLLAILPVIQQTKTVPLVRVPWNDPAHVMRALDASALGIICPMIETPDDARRFVSYCLYPPKGMRSFGPIRARLTFGDDYAKNANDLVTPIVMIETRQALDNLQEILSIDGVSGIYIGPSDLSSALGYPPGLDRREPEMVDVIAGILRQAQDSNVPACIHCGSVKYATEMRELGFSMVTVGSDARFVETGCAQTLKALAGQP